ncbi:hypothetical protein FRX31_011715 [Thalictrum thalictroides]|uniref:Uncharacterized protein n=1 Tax=Thalictrum thalictroides TaxID=46969 RepID=A0A7J6WP41_THATH|nr:hypothetical protein FRX31_011715 [Thalictrum thalictroides]
MDNHIGLSEFNWKSMYRGARSILYWLRTESSKKYAMAGGHAYHQNFQYSVAGGRSADCRHQNPEIPVAAGGVADPES